MMLLKPRKWKILKANFNTVPFGLALAIRYNCGQEDWTQAVYMLTWKIF